MAQRSDNSSPSPIAGDPKTRSDDALRKQTDSLELQLKKALKRENLANLRLSVKEKQLHELTEEKEAMRRNAEEGCKADCCMVDYSLGAMFTTMRDELRQLKSENALTVAELKAYKRDVKGTPGEVEKLPAQCRILKGENASLKSELEKVDRLENLLAYSRKTTSNLRKRCKDFVNLLDEREEQIKHLQLELTRINEENAALTRRDASDGEENASDGGESVSSESSHERGAEGAPSAMDIAANSTEGVEEISPVSSPEPTTSACRNAAGEQPNENLSEQEADGSSMPKQGTKYECDAVNVSSDENDAAGC